jgi:glycosyltransferase involved in cell wall biosynthesis
MKILLLHNAYRQRGGEDVVVEAESALLAAAGHTVFQETVSNDTIVGARDGLGLLLSSGYNRSRAEWLTRLLDETGAEVVHIHNFFPLLSPAVHEAASLHGAAVVQTLHNYRLICAAGTFLRQGSVCEKCLTGSRLWGVAHRCYRHSLPGSLAVANMQGTAVRRGIWHDHVHRFIALTDFARDKFVAGGLPPDKLVVKPNFVAPVGEGGEVRSGGLFVGRLSQEKGVHTLLEAWKALPQHHLTIIGDGPESASLQRLAGPNVTFLGALPSDQVVSHMRRAAFVAVPSIWYEGFGLTAIEAFACGTPVIASKIGSLAELVDDGVNGLLFAAGDPAALAAAADHMLSNPEGAERLGQRARQTHARLFSPAVNLAQLEAIYEDALLAASQRSAPSS